jgi:hypothetical protein
MVLGACIKPVDVETFLNNEKVKDIIESTKVAVIVDNQTEDNLIGRDRRIEGLNPDKYYMVEKETDADGILVPGTYPKYVTEHPIFPTTPGQLIDDLGFITRINGGKIIGLTNNNTYTVRAATAFLDDTPFTYTDSGGGSNQPITVTNGAITISAPTGNLTLDLTSQLTLGINYEIMAVAAPSATPKWDDFSTGNGDTSVERDNWSSLPLEGAGTTVDYVIVKTSTPLEFKVLRVVIGPSSAPSNVSFTITFPINDQASVTGPTTITRKAIYGGSTLVLTFADPVTSSWSNIQWSINGTPITGTPVSGTGGKTLTINNSATFLEFLVDNFTVNVTADTGSGNVPYSKSVTITVTEGS